MSSRGSKSGGSKGEMPKSVHSGDGSDDVVVVDETEKTVDGQACRSCGGPDTDDMVQCDQCDGWHHYDCVGVTDDVVNQSWSCTNCKTAKWIQRTTTTSGEQSTPKDTRKEHKSKRTSSTKEVSATTHIRSSSGKPKSTHSEPVVPLGSNPESSRSKKRSKPAPLEKPDPVAQPNIGIGNQKEKLFVPAVEGLPVIELEKAFSEVSCSSSQRSARNRAKLQLLRLQEEKEFEERQAERRKQQEKEEAERRRLVEEKEAERRRVAEQEEAERHREFLAKKYMILEDLASEKGSS